MRGLFLKTSKKLVLRGSFSKRRTLNKLENGDLK